MKIWVLETTQRGGEPTVGALWFETEDQAAHFRDNYLRGKFECVSIFPLVRWNDDCTADISNVFKRAAEILRSSEVVGIEMDTPRGRELWPVYAHHLVEQFELYATYWHSFASDLRPLSMLAFAREVVQAHDDPDAYDATIGC
jgi:hypothetical protein